MTVTKLHILLRGQQVWLGTAIVFIIALFIAAFGYYEQQQLLGITRNTVKATLPGLLNKQRTADNLDLLRSHGDFVADDVNLSDRRRAMAAVQLIASHPSLADERQVAALLEESVTLLVQLTPDGSGRYAMKQHWAQLSDQLGETARHIVGDSTQQLRIESERIENVVAQSRIRLGTILGAMTLLIWLSLHLGRRHAGIASAFRTMVENSPDAIFRYNLDCRQVYVNPTVERGRGIPAVTLLDKTPVDGLPDNPLGKQQLACVQQVLSSGTALETEAVWPAGGGTLRTSHVRYVPEHGRGGKVVSVLAIGRDITRLKQVELELVQSRDMLRTLMAHQEKNREAERKRTAREVHEDLGQNLMALRMNLSMLEVLADRRSGPMQTRLRLTRELTDRSIEIVRAVTTTLHPAVLDLGIIAALEWLAAEFIKQTGIVCELHLDGSDISMSEGCVMAIFRIAEEALDNVTWHVEASRVEMTLERRENDYFLCITDDGTGFDFNAAKEQCSGARERSQALDGHCEDCAQCYLLGVQERALALGGEATITSAPGAGMALKVRIPVDA